MEKVQIAKKFLGKTVLDCDDYGALLGRNGYKYTTTDITDLLNRNKIHIGVLSFFEHIYAKDGVKRYAYERIGQYEVDAYGSTTFVYLEKLTKEEVNSIDWFNDGTN